MVMAGACTPAPTLPDSLQSKPLQSHQIQYRFADATWKGWIQPSESATETIILLFTNYPSPVEWETCMARFDTNRRYTFVSSTPNGLSLTKRYLKRFDKTASAEPFICE